MDIAATSCQLIGACYPRSMATTKRLASSPTPPKHEDHFTWDKSATATFSGLIPIPPQSHVGCSNFAPCDNFFAELKGVVLHHTYIHVAVDLAD